MTSTKLFELPTPGKFLLILVVILCIGAFAYLSEYLTQRRESPEHLDRITQFDNCEDVYLDIVFVHGLGAHPYYTWTANGPRPGLVPKSAPNGPSTKSEMKINWLEHDDFLKRDFKNARILSFGYNANWFMDASLSTAPQKALTFLRALSKFRQETKRTPPIIFIGHSFGGILIKYAIHEAYLNTEFRDVTVNTASILFLGTPHQGSPVSRIGEIFARLTSFSGSDATLLKLLRHHSPALLDLKRDFSKAWEHMRGSQRPLKIYSFYETKPTFKFGVSLGIIVDAHSATLDIGEFISVNTDHSGLNKCKTEKDELYKKICDAIKSVQANLQKAIEATAKWVIGSEDAYKHHKDHKLAREKLGRYDNIGEWLIDSPPFQNWSSFSDSSKRTLWLRGGVGTGKTSVT
ncbi:uncharacterized protein F4807DRAFT_241332 [Annulohypoxylon truncatum]|uniref:uncharacterized protein n=1 Tax=Annulohypoxylon truncatum TaxID=327061 RepID=UPI0020073782|nr:uncharacterized protein F4807DRAFT_241332 [Annulohypoxylon truncatum]KAI1206212.1 hypothetical protein F4807DRAFT_241332 [Annulohypoxylon truncatum]